MGRGIALVMGLWLMAGCASRPARPDPVPGREVSRPRPETGDARPDAPGEAPRTYVGEGLASYYGPGLHGRPTASGEKFNQEAMTAAHRKLRFGTCLKVVNMENGRSVEVRINDRGPFKEGRIIDVSLAAARKLDMVEKGLARVRLYQCEEKPKPEPKSAFSVPLGALPG